MKRKLTLAEWQAKWKSEDTHTCSPCSYFARSSYPNGMAGCHQPEWKGPFDSMRLLPKNEAGEYIPHPKCTGIHEKRKP